MKSLKIEFNGDHVAVGSRKYTGEVLNENLLEIGAVQYDCKIYRYPSGKYQVVKASSRVFRVPIPGAIPQPPRRVKESYGAYYNIFGEPIDARAGKRYRIFNGVSLEITTSEPYRIYKYPAGEGVDFLRKIPDPKDPHDRQREDNVLRARTRLQQIVLSNEWTYFATFTFNDAIQDARDTSKVMEKLQRWLKNQTYRYGTGYLLVPEYHKKEQRIHAHALVNGKLKVEFNGIYKVKGIKKPVTRDTVKRYHLESRIQYPVYNIPGWRYGFSTAIEVYGSPARLANYVLKYITKQNAKIFGKSYWTSKNIQLYPTTELSTLPFRDFDNTIAKQYYHRGSKAAFKYINKTGDIIQDMADSDPNEQEVLKL